MGWPDIQSHVYEVPSEFDLTLSLTHREDRKSTRLNSSHVANSYAVFCLKKKTYIFSGPREDILNGLLRKYYGCTHGRIWRDKSGVRECYDQDVGATGFIDEYPEDLCIDC